MTEDVAEDVAQGLRWLGLSEHEVRVLQAVLAHDEVPTPTLVALTDLRHPAVSKAVRSLQHRGLLERTPNVRPCVVYLHPTAGVTLGELRDRAHERDARILKELTETQVKVNAASARRVQRGRPVVELEPVARGVPGDRERERRGRFAHDEVIDRLEPDRGMAARAWVGCASRLLVTAAEIDLEVLAAQQAAGSEVRFSDLPLPPLRILDRERVAVEVSTASGISFGWSRDARHVQAVQDLFDRWWELAEPGVVKPYPPKWDESDVEIDELGPCRPVTRLTTATPRSAQRLGSAA
jgi:DNA-binding MarR family transcriptional regulator